MLQGKGLWAYRERELDRALQIAPLMGATHILHKVGHGKYYYSGTERIARRIEQAGLIPFAWMWLLLDDPQAEAQVAVRAFQDGFRGFVFDTEADRCRNRFEPAVQLGRFIRAARLDLNKLYNCSYPNISHHRELPYDQMNQFCKGGLMPMSYGSYFPPDSTVSPDRQAQQVIDEWTYGQYEYWRRRWGYRPPLYPVLGPYHDEYGGERMDAEEFQVWLDRLAAHGPTFFSVFTAAVIGDDLLPLIRAFRLRDAATPAVPGVRVEVVSPELGFLNIRLTPSLERLPITRVNDGTVLHGLEPETDVRAKVGQRDQWLRVRTPGGVEGYGAALYLRLAEEIAEAETRVVVVSPDVGFLNVRPTRSVEQPPIAQVEDGAVLDALELETVVRARVGRLGEWLRIRTPEGVEGYVAAWYLRLYEEIAEAEVRVVVDSPEVGFLNMRPSPSTRWPPIAQVDDGAVVEALGSAEDVRAKVGREGQWLRVRTLEGVEGYVAAWYLRLYEEIPEAEVLVEVISPEVGFLSVRPTPSIERPPITRVDDGTLLEALEPEGDVQAKVGQVGQWLHIRAPGDIEGYVAAWYLRLYEEGAVGEPIPYVVVHSAIGLNVRKGPGTDTDIVWHVGDQTVLEVQDDPRTVRDKLGKNRWLKVCTPSLHEGYVNGVYVRAKRLADEREPVEDADLPDGECAWLFGIHAAGATTPADIRFLFQGKQKTGWILFTEAIGAAPYHGGGHDYTPVAHSGYGVIVRLNNGYEPHGTLPVRAKYADFARACADYVERSRGCHIWSIGNEQNNVREHPGGARNPTEHITPRMYAEAFNLARQRIKEVQPEAIVVPGAVDPYFGLTWPLTGQTYRPLDYFTEMLSYVADLDGISLHTYTHWLDIELITKKTVFTDPPLTPGTPHEHYYDFQAYRPFAEAIPAKWRERPIYITESNHWVALERRPRNPQEEGLLGWVNKDKGWVQAAYAEIHRWNHTPHAQQIHCLLLYRWTGDAWAIEHKEEVHKDFRKALDHDYRWRR